MTCVVCSRRRRIHARGACKSCYNGLARRDLLDELPSGRPQTGETVWRASYDVEDVDHAVVERILGGDFTLSATPSERIEVCRRWVARGGSLRQLAESTGWAPHRYYRISDAA